MRSYLIAAVSAVVLAGYSSAALAQDVIAERRALMKANGAAVGQLVKFIKGEEPYDSAKVKAALDTLAKDGAEFGSKFPAGSEKGGDSIASLKIWADPDGFKAELTKFQSAVAAAQTTATKDLDGLKTAMGSIGQTCQSCHSGYRERR